MDTLQYRTCIAHNGHKNAGWAKSSPNPLNLRCPPGNPIPGANPKAHVLNMSSILLRVNRSRRSEFPSTAAEIKALREAISPERLTTYVRAAHGNARRALDLYVWNVNAAAALYAVLQVNEIALRNAINRALVSQFGAHWPYSAGFLRTLPTHERDTFESGRSRLERNLRLPHVSTGDVVAAQTYGFWVMLLTARFQGRIWQQEFATSFPGAPPQVTRAVVHDRAEEIRRLRNRIAHHEPLLNHDLLGAYQRAASMVRWVSPMLSQWAAIHWPVNRELLKRP